MDRVAGSPAFYPDAAPGPAASPDRMPHTAAFSSIECAGSPTVGRCSDGIRSMSGSSTCFAVSREAMTSAARTDSRTADRDVRSTTGAW